MTPFKSFFCGLAPVSDSSWDRFEALFRPQSLKKGEYFISEGQMAHKVAFLNKGILRAFYRHSNGTEYNKHFFLNPCFIGAYTSLITGTVNQINQEALSDCEILVAQYTEIEALYALCPDLERAARRLVELFFIQKEQREIELVLLDANERYRIFQSNFPQLEQLIPQYHIASYLGITPTQLSRIRKKAAKK
ncbi:Crp/Fnr family transcriptional regulator [Marinilongibacter aquaticus]|uniref:Crp/Fnr family transcriptional regulator n=1 Tax=Marinilongibacter aquaticus TaxID=2975157 RepID=UPI0021BD4CEF|nr:Crp/Fnr family transcriptional regulator [Marinilongibacter aquaticus]UBM59661.1 Crp/Fnr family transcriptional regulator [Marinilongibacter aquaticus]